MSRTKYIDTPRGNYVIEEIFKDRKEALDKGYSYAFAHNGFDFYLKYPRGYNYQCALVPNGM